MKDRRGISLKMMLVLAAGLLHAGAAPSSEIYTFAAVLGLIYFFISFFSTAFGLAIIAVAMLFSPEIQIGALGSRNIVLRVEDFLIPVLMIAWMAQTAVQRGKKLFVDSPLNKLIVFLLLVSIVSTAIGFARGTTKLLPAFFYLGKTTEFFALFYLVLNFIQSERQVRFFLFFAIITVAFLAVYTLLQVPNTEMFTARRITTPFEDRPQPATAGGYLAFSFFLVFSMLLYQKSFFRRLLMGTLSIMVLIPLLYTFSRTAYLALAGGLVVLILLSKLRWAKFALAGVLLLSPVLLPSAVKNRIAYTWQDAKNPGRNLGVDFSFQERLYAFRRVGSVMRESPLIGLGIASWEYPDNQYIRTLHEIGILGFWLWLAIFGRLFRMARWLYASYPDGTFKGLALGYTAGVAGILLHGMGSCTFYIVRMMEPFWFVSGLIAALYVIKTKEFYSQQNLPGRHESV